MVAMAPGSQKKLIIAMAICATASLASAQITLSTATVAKNSPEDYVELHNTARAAAGAGPVSWDGEAARHAAMRAATGCNNTDRTAGLQSRSAAGGGGYGGNVFRATPGRVWAAADAMRTWTAPAAREHVQVVWPSSDRIGCAHAVCPGDRGVVISCSYKPAVKEELREVALSSYCRYNISRCFDCPIC